MNEETEMSDAKISNNLAKSILKLAKKRSPRIGLAGIMTSAIHAVCWSHETLPDALDYWDLASRAIREEIKSNFGKMRYGHD